MLGCLLYWVVRELPRFTTDAGVEGTKSPRNNKQIHACCGVHRSGLNFDAETVARAFPRNLNGRVVSRLILCGWRDARAGCVRRLRGVRVRLSVSGVALMGWGGVLLWVIIGVGEAVPRGSALVCSVVYSPS